VIISEATVVVNEGAAVVGAALAEDTVEGVVEGIETTVVAGEEVGAECWASEQATPATVVSGRAQRGVGSGSDLVRGAGSPGLAGPLDSRVVPWFVLPGLLVPGVGGQVSADAVGDLPF
jgi:hypothetical protein